MVQDDGEPLQFTNALKSFVNAKKCRALAKGGKYKVEEGHHFNVHVTGLLGKLPKSDDIKMTVGDKYDLLSAFQTYFLFGGEIYALTTYSQPLDKIKSIKGINCFLVLGNENMHSSRKDCM